MQLAKHRGGLERQLTWLQTQFLSHLLLKRQPMLSKLTKFGGMCSYHRLKSTSAACWAIAPLSKDSPPIISPSVLVCVQYFCALTLKKWLQELCSYKVLSCRYREQRLKTSFSSSQLHRGRIWFCHIFLTAHCKRKKSEQELLIFMFSFWQQTPQTYAWTPGAYIFSMLTEDNIHLQVKLEAMKASFGWPTRQSAKPLETNIITHLLGMQLNRFC